MPAEPPAADAFVVVQPREKSDTIHVVRSLPVTPRTASGIHSRRASTDVRPFKTHTALLLLFSAVLTFVCVRVFLDEPPPHQVDSQKSLQSLPTGKVPLLTSSMSTKDVIPQLKKGMQIREATSLFDTIPFVGAWRTTYRLKDGAITLYFSEDTLEDWYIQTE